MTSAVAACTRHMGRLSVRKVAPVTRWREATRLDMGFIPMSNGPTSTSSSKPTGAPKSCCVPSTVRDPIGAPTLIARSSRHAESDRVRIPGGTAEVGTDSILLAVDGEGPRRVVKLAPYWVDVAAVSNERFAAFVSETGYVTEAERFGWSFVFQNDLPEPPAAQARSGEANWWCRTEGAYWRAPEGPGSSVSERADHPVVHVSHRDAEQFATWAGGRLLREAEWEHAARGGRAGTSFPWGDDEPTDEGPFRCNIWQGDFPETNTAADGFASTCPVRSFEPNGYGLYNMSGNVWEWCSDRFRVRSLRKDARALNEISEREDRRLLKGGSYLCHRSYCYRYRIAARTGQAPDTSTTHIGFRIAYDD